MIQLDSNVDDVMENANTLITPDDSSIFLCYCISGIPEEFCRVYLWSFVHFVLQQKYRLVLSTCCFAGYCC